MPEHRATEMRKCRRMKFLCIIYGCPTGARKWHISYFCHAFTWQKNNGHTIQRDCVTVFISVVLPTLQASTSYWRCSRMAACVAWKKRRNQPLDCRNLSSLAYLQYYTIKMLIFQYVEQKKAPAQNEQEPLFTHII